MPDQLAEPVQDYVEEQNYVEEELEPEWVETIEEDVSEPDYELSVPDLEDHRASRRRRRRKFIRFIVFETLVLALLLVSAKLAVMERFSENSLSVLYGVVVVISAIAAALIPVLFYALPPTLPSERQQ